MKRSVNLSTYSLAMSFLAILFIGGLAVYNYHQGDIWKCAVLGGLLFIMCVLTLFYMPLSISVDDNYLTINRSLWCKNIPLSEIKSIIPNPPTMGERRIFANGGWFGYWGWFSQRDLGKYFAYYGKASDCFLVTLKNGRKYLLGCKDPNDIVDFVTQKIS